MIDVRVKDNDIRKAVEEGMDSFIKYLSMLLIQLLADN